MLFPCFEPESAHHLEESLAELTSRERPDKEASGQKWREWHLHKEQQKRPGATLTSPT